MLKIGFFLAILGSLGAVKCQQSAYGQCGGIGWTGATTCVAGYTCLVLNAYYSQCTPGSASSSAAPPPSTSVPSSTATTPTTTSGSSSAPSASSTAVPAGDEIRADQDPVYHLYLQNQGGAAVLGPESTDGRFNVSSTIILNSPTGGAPLYLNIASGNASYLPVSFGTTASTTGWALEGDTIITSQSSPWGRQLNFIVCQATGGFWDIYLQIGNGQPAGQNCTGDISLHLPCLC